MNNLFQIVTKTSEAEFTAEQHVSARSAIFIKGLKLDMFIGVFDEEKLQKQPVIIDLDIQVKNNDQWRNDDVNDVVSYAEIVAMIEDIASKSNHIELIETFAETVIQMCFDGFDKIKSINISITKSNVIENATSVGAIIYRER